MEDFFRGELVQLRDLVPEGVLILRLVDYVLDCIPEGDRISVVAFPRVDDVPFCHDWEEIGNGVCPFLVHVMADS